MTPCGSSEDISSGCARRRDCQRRRSIRQLPRSTSIPTGCRAATCACSTAKRRCPLSGIWPARKTARGQPISAATNNGILRELRGLFCWLADQPGLRSRIRHADAAWFSPDRRSEQARHGELWKPHPSPEQMAHVIRSMPRRSVFERRDQALMAFLFLTGAREQTAMSVRLGHVDLSNRCVHFNGRLVDTKFGKRFSTAFFPVGQAFETILTEWMRELRETHLWGPTDPLFPKAAMGLGPTGGFMAVGLAREPWCSPARLVKIFKGAFESVGLPPFGPHSVRRTLVQLAQGHCRTPEQFKAWSQNLGHDDVLTTFISYGSVATGRQMELIGRMREGVAARLGCRPDRWTTSRLAPQLLLRRSERQSRGHDPAQDGSQREARSQSGRRGTARRRSSSL